MLQNLVAHLCTDSNLAMLDFVTGSHPVEAYSSCRRTMDLYHLAFTSFGQPERFLRRQAVVWLTLFVTVSVWLFQDSLLSMVIPRYLAFEVPFKVCP